MRYFVRQVVAIFVIVFAFVSVVHAQASRTWVSGVGDDANPCSRTAPCKTFAGAISKTAAGGEIDALDPAGFGAVTITKSITIDGGGGQVASVLVSGTNGIVVNAGSADVVVLRNVRFAGIGSGLSGVLLLSAGSLVVDHCTINGFLTNGIEVSLTAPGQVLVNDTVIQGGTAGIKVDGTTGPGPINVSMRNVTAQGGSNGLDIQRGHVDVNGSLFTGNTGFGVIAEFGTVSLSNTTLSYNGTGVQSNSGSSVRLSNVDILDNTTGIGSGGGQVLSAGNNRNVGNATPGAPNGSVTIQ